LPADRSAASFQKLHFIKNYAMEKFQEKKIMSVSYITLTETYRAELKVGVSHTNGATLLIRLSFCTYSDTSANEWPC
jgi:hypothetical protein